MGNHNWLQNTSGNNEFSRSPAFHMIHWPILYLFFPSPNETFSICKARHKLMTVWEIQRNWRKQPSVSRFKFVWESVYLSAILNHSVIIKMKSTLRIAVAFRSLNVLLFPKANRNKLSNNVCFLQTSEVSYLSYFCFQSHLKSLTCHSGKTWWGKNSRRHDFFHKYKIYIL